MEVGVLLRKVSYLNIRNNLGGKRKLIISSNFWDSLKSFVGTKFNSIWVEIENLKISDYPKKVFFFGMEYNLCWSKIQNNLGRNRKLEDI